MVSRTDVVLAEIRCTQFSRVASVKTSADGRVGEILYCSGSLGGLDVGELDALGLDRGPVEASLPMGDIASRRRCALHKLAPALLLVHRCAGNTERQRESSQSGDLEERSHVCFSFRATPLELCTNCPPLRLFM